MKKYNCLIIGCGAQGCGVGQEKNPDKIINFAHALALHEGFHDISVCDKDIDRAVRASDTWGFRWGSIESFLTLKPHKDTVIVTTPDDTHYEILKLLAEYPLKLVICEKPICTDLQQAREIVELYKDKGIPLMVNYTRRFLPYYDHLKQYGKPRYTSCYFNRGWIHTASHAIDFFNMLGIEDYYIKEISDDYKRIWDINIHYNDYDFHELRIGDRPVWDYYDKSHMHIIDNAYEFLEGREEIKCTGEMALRALEKCYELMNG